MTQPQNIGPFEIRAVLGYGGMATVYRAYDPPLDRELALKVVSKTIADDNTFIERFKREAQALARLNHPNILSIYGFGENDGTPYIVMPIIPDGNLGQRMGKPLDLVVTGDILTQVASALDYAHRNNIVHRDVKPSNILFDGDRAILSDFGIAKALQNAEMNLTRTGGMMGTPGYMSPEQVMGQPADGRSDQYALGIVVYEMLTGVKPFRAETPYAVMNAHVTQPLPDPREFNSTIPSAVVAVLRKALAKKPEDRYTTSGEFAAAFKQAAKEQDAATLPVPSRPGPPLGGIGVGGFGSGYNPGPPQEINRGGYSPIQPQGYVPPVGNYPVGQYPSTPLPVNTGPQPGGYTGPAPINATPTGYPPPYFPPNVKQSITPNRFPVWAIVVIVLAVVIVGGCIGIIAIAAAVPSNETPTPTAYSVVPTPTTDAGAQDTATGVAITAPIFTLHTPDTTVANAATAPAPTTASNSSPQVVLAGLIKQTQSHQCCSDSFNTLDDPGPAHTKIVTRYMPENDGKAVLSDFGAQVQMCNPYAASTGAWDYGFVFRSASAHNYRLFVRSDKKWQLDYSDNGAPATLKKDTISTAFDTGAGQHRLS